jgi:hypothetical protein
MVAPERNFMSVFKKILLTVLYPSHARLRNRQRMPVSVTVLLIFAVSFFSVTFAPHFVWPLFACDQPE